MKINDVAIYRVTWSDAQDSDGNWTDIKDIQNHELATCQDVGWMVHRDETRLVLMRSRIVEKDEELREGGGHIAIPNSWVIKVERLEPVIR